MTTRSVSRRHFLAAIPGAVALLAGVSCGDDDDAPQPTGTSVSPRASASAAGESTAASDSSGLRLIPLPPEELGAPPVPPARASSEPDATPYELALAPYAGFGTDAAPGVFPRVLVHAMGETTIEAAPKRIVVMDTGELDGLVELGIKPVGAVDYGSAGLPSYLEGATDGVELVGSVSEPNLEAIAALQPDLILSNKLRHEDIYGQLSDIAPTVFAERPGVSWKHNFAFYAQAVGREEDAAGTVLRFEERVRSLNELLPDPRPTVSVVRILEGNIRYYQRANFLGVLFTDLGLPRPEAQNVDDFGVDLGLESIGEYAPGDLIVLALYGGEANEFSKSVLDSPLWTGLEPVKAGNVLTVDDQTWIGGIGYKAAFTVLDQLEAHFRS